MKETFFTFSNNTLQFKKFTWAWSIIPRSEMIDRRCSDCGSVEKHPGGEFDVLLENGSEFPDVLGCGTYPFLILSERVIAALVDARLSAFHTFRVGVAGIKSRSKVLMEKLPPNYYRVEIDGGCQIDLKASGLEVVRYCPKCHHLMTSPMLSNGFQIIPGSYDGADLFRDSQLYPGRYFCKETLPAIVQRYRFTNFRFEFMQGPRLPGRGLDIAKLFK